MDELFLKIFNMSVTATWLVLAVIAARFLLKRAPKWINVAMWALVGVRLVCPISFESVLSLVPSAETVPADIVYAQTPAINSGVYVINSVVNPVMSESFTPTPGASINPIQIFLFLAEVVWIVGMVGMLIYTLVSYLLLLRKVREATPAEGNVWLCDRISSPFILGVIRPRIYLPSDISEADVEYVLAHERAHLTRRDHWWKPLGFLLLSVHWFNPILWIGYVLLCRDIEIACDEKVLANMGTGAKKPYSDALINASVSRKVIAACPLAFGEVGVKTRIKSVLNYKKPAFWIIVVALILCVVLAVGFLTDPVTDQMDERLAAFIDVQIYDHHKSAHSDDNYCCMDYTVIGEDKRGDEVTVYMWVLYEEYSLGSDGELVTESGAHMITAITAKKVADYYELLEYWTPRDGNLYAKDIMDKIPPRLWGEATDSQRYIGKQAAQTEKMAREYFASLPDTPETDGYFESVPQYLINLKTKYPEYFGLDTTNGLDLYYYRTAAAVIKWVLLPGKDTPYSKEEMGALPQITAEEMRAIVDSYGIPKTSVTIRIAPGSDTCGPDDVEDYSTAKKVFWNTLPDYDALSVSPAIESLRLKYPEYFGLDATNGLEVYWYQMARDNYNWVLLPGRQAHYTSHDVIELPPATTAEMRAIVDSYGLTRDWITVSYMAMPHSSYMIVAPDLQEYYKEVEKMFWSTVPMVDASFVVPNYGSLVFDIDKDGRDEVVTLGLGRTSGVFSFSISASYHGEQKYLDYFMAPHCAPQFLVRSATDVCLMIKAQAEKGQPEVAVLYEISVIDGHIVLTAGEEAKDLFELTHLPTYERQTNSDKVS